MPTLVSFDPANHDSATAEFDIGGLYDAFYNGVLCTFRYVRFVDAIAYAKGHACTWASTTTYDVTNDRTGGSSLGPRVAGIAMRVHTQNYYGFVMVSGLHDAVLGDGNVTAATTVMTDTSVDGGSLNLAGGSEHLVFGLALAADSGSPATFPCQLQGIL